MTYKNLPSEKFYHFMTQKLQNGDIKLTEIASKFDKYQSNPGVLLRSIKNGKNSVTVELILLAQKHFGLNPCDLFHEQNENIPSTEQQALLGKVDKLLEVIQTQQQTINTLLSGGNELRRKNA